MLQPDWQKADAIARAVLTSHDGVAKLRTFIDAGLVGRQLAGMLARGVVERPRSGWYVDPELSWQAKSAVRVGGVLGCASVVDSFGLPTPPAAGRDVHVVVPRNSARLRHHRDRRHYVVPDEDPDIRVHWEKHARTYRGWRTPLVDALLLLVDCVPLDWWIAALDAALHRPRTGGEPVLSDDEYARFGQLLPRRLRKHLEIVDPRAESPLETLLRLGLIRRGIGPLTLQFSPDDRRFVDILVGDRLIVEADGAEFHDPAQDAARDAAFRRLGYVVLRFGYDRIVFDLDGVLDEIEAALATL